jgi:hypothetical protein
MGKMQNFRDRTLEVTDIGDNCLASGRKVIGKRIAGESPKASDDALGIDLGSGQVSVGMRIAEERLDGRGG